MPVTVYSSPDGRRRCICFDDDTPPAPLVLIATFLDDEEEEAWKLPHDLGRHPSVA